MASCEINITNKWSDTKFFLLQDLPAPSNGPSSTVFSNVYQSTSKVAGERDGSSTTSFSIEPTFYAVYGTSSGPANKTKVKTSAWKKIKLGPAGSIVGITNKNGSIDWDDVTFANKKSDAKSGFEFNTDGTIPGDGIQNLYVGVGAADPNNASKVVPISTWKAESSLKTLIFPKLTYYVVTGDGESGQLFDRSKIGKYVRIDFEGSKVRTANVVLEEDGTWSDEDNISLNNGVKIETS